MTLASCAHVTPAQSGDVSFAQIPDADSRIGLLLNLDGQPSARALVVEDPRMALTTRIDMIELADHTIDAQYFIWQNDPTGIFVIDRLLEAADRGVRVRALVDDVQLEGLVDRLTALDQHPSIEIRIFNPFSVRLRYRLGLIRLAEFAIDGNRLNHRMHNKLLVADNQLAILGGRNIGDDYFGKSPVRNFVDTDLLLSGRIVSELSAGFDTYWNSRWSLPVDELVNLTLTPDDLADVRQRVRQRLEAHPQLTALTERDFHESVTSLTHGFDLENALTVVDDPDVSWGERPDEIAAELTEFALSAQREVLVVSPYLVPTENLLGIAETLIDRGVKIRVVTNSLASNDVVIAHAAYARFRETLLEAGVDLFEFRGDPKLTEDDMAEDVSLHSKFIIFDDDIVFLGSLNLDPRSLYLNTELGVVLESSTLAEALRNSFNNLVHPDNSWRVILTPDGLRWMSSAGTLTEQPAKSGWQRFRARVLSLLPLSSQL